MEGTPLRFTVLKGPVDAKDAFPNVRIFLCLSGSLTVTEAAAAGSLPSPSSASSARGDAGVSPSVLEVGDLHLVNAGASCHIASREVRYLRFELDIAELQRCFPDRVLAFACSSVTSTNDSVERLRALLSEAVAVAYEQDELAGARFRGIFYDIAALLMGRFSVSVEHGTSDRMAAIRAFVAQHYAENLSVERMGRAFFVTPQYFSKYVKDQTGETFHRYLERVRVGHAALALEHTNDTVLKVALDNGFPNAESLRRAFERAYGTTPAAFRRQRREADALRAPLEMAPLEEAVQLMGARRHEGPAGEELIVVDAAAQTVYEPYWRDAVNLGELVTLENYEVRDQFTRFQELLKFDYVRFGVSHAFVAGDEEMRRRALYFEDQQIDYLFNLGARPWIMFEYTPDVPPERYAGYLREQIAHYANRIDMSNVLAWRFELATGAEGLTDVRGYLDCFAALSEVLAQVGHREGLIGPNLALRDLDDLERWAHLMAERGLALPVQTFRVDSDVAVRTSSGGVSRRASDSSYIKDQLYALARRLPAYREGIRALRVTEWNSAYAGENVLNDSCYRGAATIKNLIDCFGDVASLAPTRLFDAMDAFSQQRGMLFGGDGMVSRHGIPKPSFFAYELMNRAGAYYLAKGEHVAVFSNGSSNYQVICHNAKRLSAAYYAMEDQPGVDDLPTLFEDRRPLTVRIRITGVRDGTYLIKKRSISSAEGSVQDKLVQMGDASLRDIHPNDLAYLRRVTTPRITLGEARAKGGVLELAIELAANEFANVHAIYQFK